MTTDEATQAQTGDPTLFHEACYTEFFSCVHAAQNVAVDYPPLEDICSALVRSNVHISVADSNALKNSLHRPQKVVMPGPLTDVIDRMEQTSFTRIYKCSDHLLAVIWAAVRSVCLVQRVRLLRDDHGSIGLRIAGMVTNNGRLG